jgi:thiol:disulfide interchange protein DsbC
MTWVLRVLGAVVFCLYVSGGVFAFDKSVQGCMKECGSCHAATKEEVAKLINKIDPSARVEKVEPSQSKGLYAVTLSDKTESAVIYLDYAKKNLFLGKIISIDGAQKPAEQMPKELNKSPDQAGIPLDNALVLGNQKGSKKIIVFSDPECSFCGNLHDELLKLVQEDAQIGVYIILFDLEINPDSGWKTVSILCKSKESSTEAMAMLEENYKNKKIKKLTCDQDYAAKNKNLAKELGITGTPAMILPDGRIVMGYTESVEIKKLLADQKQ